MNNGMIVFRGLFLLVFEPPFDSVMIKSAMTWNRTPILLSYILHIHKYYDADGSQKNVLNILSLLSNVIYFSHLIFVEEMPALNTKSASDLSKAPFVTT
jgi:hypothetical protein